MPITKWTPDQVLKEVRGNLESNGAVVGKFVESDARRRLLAIREPAWGEKYRTLVVSRLLMFQVESKPNEVVIYVGVAQGKGGTYIGFYIEVGSKTAPAQPYLRPAVFENGRKIAALLEGA